MSPSGNTAPEGWGAVAEVYTLYMYIYTHVATFFSSHFSRNCSYGTSKFFLNGDIGMVTKPGDKKFNVHTVIELSRRLE